MTSDIRSTNKTRWWLFILGIATVIVIISLIRSSHLATPDPNDILRDTVAQVIQNNISKLSCAVLVWSSERKHFGPWSSKPQTAGNHKLWWNNNKIAISCKTNTAIQDPNGQATSKQETILMTYDGKKFWVAEIPTGSTGKVEMVISKKPPHSFNINNYLQGVGWQGSGVLNHVSKATEPGVEHWLTEDNKTIKRTFHNTRTGQVGVWIFDVEKAYGLTIYENYAKENTLQSRRTIQYKQVSRGAWFPISVNTEGHNIQNGELIYRYKMELDSTKSTFNDPSAIPEDVFELKIGPNTEETDLTSLKTRLKMRLNDF
ncbi:MAG: hypothetical protein GY774_05370 [Planctomycetes bacterium]|nr:hypothetical protein [Planctomycetota bacterium]